MPDDKPNFEIVENFDYPVSLNEDTPLYDLLSVVGTENRRVSLDIEELYDDRFLSQATGAELNKIGDLVGVTRKNNEADSKLRKRIRAEWAAQASGATYDEFAQITLSILETEEKFISIDTPPYTAPKRIEISVDSKILDSSPLSRRELSSLLERSISADASIVFADTGTFAFAGGDDALKGWDEGTWTSGSSL